MRRKEAEYREMMPQEIINLFYGGYEKKELIKSVSAVTGRNTKDAQMLVETALYCDAIANKED